MNELTCKDCLNFRQHYILDEERCQQVQCGHCVHPRLKSKKPDAPACIHFIQADPERYQPLTKSYLTKELLHYLLSLDLPPETITDALSEVHKARG